MEIGDRLVAKRLINDLRVEQRNGVDDVQRCPADEELQHHHEQHLDDAFFVLQALFRVGAARTCTVLGLRM